MLSDHIAPSSKGLDLSNLWGFCCMEPSLPPPGLVAQSSHWPESSVLRRLHPSVHSPLKNIQAGLGDLKI
jgi:hypothetical protein